MTGVVKIVAVGVFLVLGAGVAGYLLRDLKLSHGVAANTAEVRAEDAVVAPVVDREYSTCSDRGAADNIGSGDLRTATEHGHSRREHVGCAGGGHVRR